MEASGVRSSWLASATNARTFASLACRTASAEPTESSRLLSAAPTCPTSVRGLVSFSGTRCGRSTSPRSSGSAATFDATDATRRSGRRDRPTTSAPMRAATMIAPSTTSTIGMSAAAIWCLRALRGSPTTSGTPKRFVSANSRYAPIPLMSTSWTLPSAGTCSTATV